VVPPAEAAAPRLVEFPNPNIAQAYGYRDFEKYRCRVKGVCGLTGSEIRGLPLLLAEDQKEDWSGRGDLNARPPAPKAVSKKL